MAERVIIKVSGLAPDTSEERIKVFFEDRGENISVGSCSLPDGGVVTVELIGITETELDELLTGNHKLSKRSIQLEKVTSDAPATEVKRNSVTSLIEVHGVSGFEKDDLELYFETPKAGGRKGSVKSCTIEPDGIARIEFDNPEVAAGVMSVTNHSLFGTPLKLTYPPLPDLQASQHPSKIWLTEVPSVLLSELDYLELFLARIVGETLPFSLSQVNSTTLLLEFSKDVHLSKGELEQIAEKIRKKEVKKSTLKPTLTPVATPPVAGLKPNMKLLLTTSESIDTEHLSLVLEITMNLEINKDFSVDVIKSGNYLVTFQKDLSNEELESLIKSIETKPKIKIKAKHMDCCQLLLSELPSIEISHLELLLQKTIGHRKDFMLKGLKSSRALLEFKTPLSDEELGSVIESITNTKVKSVNIKVQKLELPYEEEPSSTPQCQLLLSGIPFIDLDHLCLLIEKATCFQCGSDFVIEHKDGSFLMTCNKLLSDKEFESLLPLITKVQVKGAHLKVQSLKEETASGPVVLLISNMPPSCHIDYLGLLLEKSLQMEINNHFDLVEHSDSSALITFKKDSLSSEELGNIIGKINKTTVKGQSLKGSVFNMKKTNGDSDVNESCLLLQDAPDNADEEYLMVVLSKAMGIDDSEFSVKCRGNGAALLTFKTCFSDTELLDIIGKINKTVLKGKSLKASMVKSDDSQGNGSCLFLQGVSDSVDEEYLVVVLSKAMGIDDSKFSVKCLGNGAALLSFKTCLSDTDLQDMIHKIGSKQIKGCYIKALSWQTTPCIFISGISEHYDEEFLKNYLENTKRSGGGEVVSVELFGNGEAQVMFKDLKVMRNVIKMPHQESLGKDVSVIQDNPLKKFNSSRSEPTLQSVLIKVSPHVVKAIQREQAHLNGFVSNLHVKVTVDVDQATINVIPSKYTPAGWKKCETVISNYIEKNFASTDLPMSNEAKVDILLLLAQKYGDITYSLSEDNKVLHLVGHPNTLTQIETEVCQIVASVAIIDEQLTLDLEDYDFIYQIKQQNLTEMFSTVKVTFSAPNKISLNGAARDVKKIQKNITKLSVHSSVNILMDPLLTEFVGTNDGCEQLKTHIHSSEGVFAAICVKGSGSSRSVVALCDSEMKDKITKAARNVQKKLHVEKLTLSPKCHGKLLNVKQEYNEMCEQLQKKHGVIVKRSNDCICIAGFKDKVNTAFSALADFINIKCQVERSVQIEGGMLKLFQTHMKSDWDTMFQHLKSIEIVATENKNAIVTLSGKIDAVDDACEALVLLEKKVYINNVNPPSYTSGFREYEKSNAWNTFISGTETLHKVCISILNLEEVSELCAIPADEAYTEECEDSPVRCTSLFQFQSKACTPSNLKYVKIQNGSLLDVKADVYVNSTNSDLDLTGGTIAKILLTAAGPTLQEECKRKAPIAPGEIAITGSGNIKCKHIFHVSLITYNGPGGNAEQILRKAMENCLDLCRQQKITSIVFPALGTGAVGFPAHIAAKIMMESIANSKDLSGITLYFIIFMDNVLKAFEEMKASMEGNATKPFKTGSKTMSKPKLPKDPSSSSARLQKDPKKCNTSHLQSSMRPTSVDDALKMENVTIQIVQGDITDQSTDVVVNSTGSELIGTTGVSGAIFKKGGPEFKKACEAYIAQKKKLDVGQIAVIPASGGLKCKSVFHINVDPAKLEMVVTECLRETESQKYHSISFPALATGNHKFSATSVANEMYKAFSQYAAKNPQYTTLISVVIFQRELLDPFLNTFESSSLNKTTEVVSDICTTVSDSNEANGNKAISFFFRIFGESEAAVKRATAALNEHLTQNFVCEHIDKLVIEPSARVRKFCTENHVILTINGSSSLMLSGLKQKVDDARRKIDNENKDEEKKISLNREAELLQKQIQWRFQSSLDHSYVPYPPGVNIQIEKAYQDQKAIYSHDDPVDAFWIDFKALTETKKSSNTSVLVKREDLLARYREDKPKTWEKMPIDPHTKAEQMCQLFDLKTTDAEYIDVLQRFASTVTAKRIIKIERVQNTMLYGQYIARKNAMEKFNPGIKNENVLFHGTSADTCHKINSQGFNRSFAGKNATAYGVGVYFAVNASYSAQLTYSPPDANGYKYIYVVRVLTGEFTPGNSSMIVPPPKDPIKNPNLLYDSLVDRLPNPTMYIIFQDAQAYPEYLITFVM